MCFAVMIPTSFERLACIRRVSDAFLKIRRDGVAELLYAMIRINVASKMICLIHSPL